MSRKKEKQQKQQKEPLLIDLTDRDPNNINRYLRTLYPDVLAEPDPSTFSMDCLWQNSFTCYSCSKNCCYKLLTTLLSIPLALCWGCCFGITTFIHIWFCQPVLRCTHIVMKCVKTCVSISLATFIGPWFEVMALVLSRMHVTWARRNTPPRPYMEKLYSYEHGDDYKKQPFVAQQTNYSRRVQPVVATKKTYQPKTTSSSEQFVTRQREVEDVNETYVRRSEPEPQPSKYAYYYENEKQLQPVVAPPPPPPVTKQPAKQQQQVQYYRDSFDQIPTHSSTFSDERMPNRSYKPPRQPHYFEKTEAYKYKTVNNNNERYKTQYLTASDYYSGYNARQPEPEAKRVHYTINTRPKWKF